MLFWSVTFVPPSHRPVVGLIGTPGIIGPLCEKWLRRMRMFTPLGESPLPTFAVMLLLETVMLYPKNAMPSSMFEDMVLLVMVMLEDWSISMPFISIRRCCCLLW